LTNLAAVVLHTCQYSQNIAERPPAQIKSPGRHTANLLRRKLVLD
jgi:hypothetical protein